MASTNARQVSWISATGRNWASRRTTSAAVHERVVGTQGLRRVTSLADDAETAPAAAFLTDRYREQTTSRHRQWDAAGLRDDVVGLHSAGGVLGEPPRPV